MWALISRRWQVMILVGITALLLLGLQAASEWWTGTSLSLLKFVSLVASIIGSVLALFVNLIWRRIWQALPILNRVFFPDLNGKWEGSLQTTWVDPTTNEVPAPIATRVTIRQGILSISVKQRTEESDFGPRV